MNYSCVISRIVIRLSKISRARPAANTRAFRPDKCLLVKSLDSRVLASKLRWTGRMKGNKIVSMNHDKLQARGSPPFWTASNADLKMN
jgi:hypothetical protein